MQRQVYCAPASRPHHTIRSTERRFFPRKLEFLRTYLVQVDYGLPELVLGLVVISHADLSKVTWMVSVEIGSVVMLTTSHTATSWMLAVLSNATVTGGNMAAAKELCDG